MGTTSSTSSKRELSPTQKDIKYLGERMPFGDAELYQVYNAYQCMLSKPKEERISFLTDIAILSLPKPKQQTTTNVHGQEKEEKVFHPDERMILMQAVEHKILPKNFGNRLYEVAFLHSQLTSEYDDSNDDKNAKSSTPPPIMDEYARLARLEAFFHGLSDGTRRGAKKTLTVLYRCCQHHEVPDDVPTTTTESQQLFQSNDFAYAGSTPSSAGGAKLITTVIDPIELVEMGYRIALASGFLSAANSDDDSTEQNLSDFLPPNTTTGKDDDNVDTNTTTTGLAKDPALLALAKSLSDSAKRRKERRSGGGMYGTSMSGTVTSTAASKFITNKSTGHVMVSEDDVQEWSELVAPMFASSLATLLHLIFFPNRPYPPTRTKFDYPQISTKNQKNNVESTFFLHGTSSPLLYSFACMSPALGGEYYRLYTSASDGLSFNRLQNALLGYGGPTLIIIRSVGDGNDDDDDGSSIFGAFTSSPWKESKDFYGNTDCFLYQVLPTTAVYRPSGNGTSYMYCNSFSRSRGYDKQAHGIGFGGNVHQPRLFIAESFDNCRAGIQDMTFDHGPLLAPIIERKDGTKGADDGDEDVTTIPRMMFEIESLEVWGVGGTEVVQEALGERSKQRDIKQAAINKARKVDKAAFLDDFRSGLIESKAFAHRGQIRGREEAVVDDNDLNNYKYPTK